MPRTEDIVYIEGQIAELNTQQKLLAEGFAAYAANAAQQIEQVLKDAGVREIVHAIEQSRAQRQSEDQARVNALVAKVQELERVKAFLEDRERSQMGPTGPVGAVGLTDGPGPVGPPGPR